MVVRGAGQEVKGGGKVGGLFMVKECVQHLNKVIDGKLFDTSPSYNWKTTQQFYIFN